MNKRPLQLLIFVFLQFLIVAIHLFLTDILPHPYHHFNFALTFLILYVTIVIDPRTLWKLLPLIWFEELFSSLPFGVNAAAILIVLLVFNFSLITIFSNRSLPTIILSSISMVFFYRIILWGILKATHFLTLANTITMNTGWILNVIWEILFTTLITALTYFTLTFFLKRLRPEYITALQKEYESKRYFR